jgi:uncharacterized OsmC-like protein
MQWGEVRSVRDELIRAAIATAGRYLAEHPAEARYTDQSATVVMESGLRFRAEYPGGVISTDMPASIGGRATAPSPGWLWRASLAACEATLIKMRAASLGIAIERLEVTVDSESDDRGILGLDDSVPAGPLSGRVRVQIAAPGASAAQLREVVGWADRHCPVADGFRRAIPLTLEVLT